MMTNTPVAETTGIVDPVVHIDVAVHAAALLIVLHRRTGQDRLSIVCDIGGCERTISADLADDPTFQAVVDQVDLQLHGIMEPGDANLNIAPLHNLAGTLQVAEQRWTVHTVEPSPEVAHSGLQSAVRAAVSFGSQDPQCPILRLPLVSEAQAAEMLRLGTADQGPGPALCIHDLVAAQARRIPDATAVTAGTDGLTYGQLDSLSDDLAARLRHCGVNHGDVVAVLLPRTPQMIVTLLSILKAGAAYLALDPQQPAARHDQLLSESGATLAISDKQGLTRLPQGVRSAELTSLLTADAPPMLTTLSHVPNDLAYVSYTSGSTGTPRGVAVPHGAVTRLVQNPNWIEIKAEDVFLQLAPVAFDASTLEIWTPLAHGCRLALAPAGPVDLQQVAETIRDEQVSVLWLTAGLFHQFVNSKLDAFANVRHLIAGGDVLSPNHVRIVLDAYPDLTFTNGYGPTENTTFTTCWTSRTAPICPSVPIGKPISGTQVAVLDQALCPVPVGVAGELYAAGEGLAWGYLNSPADTASRFLPDTISGAPGARMYRTGDLVEWSADGNLQILGRSDHQVKIHGYRLEPGEVEAALTQHDLVQDAVVIAQECAGSNKRMIAYVVPVAGQPAAPDLGTHLRESLREILPPYAIPWAILVRDTLPLNGNGKVDRSALPTATRLPRNVGNDFVAPRNATEQRLAELWGSILEVEPIGAEDDFFDLGGHSLLVAELLTTLHDEFGTDVPARVLYLQPTLAELAAELTKATLS